MAWRLAKSLITLRNQIDALAPNRSKSSDGTIGDSAHASRRSDHNPDSNGVVRAMDITNDPSHGVVAHALARDIVNKNKDRGIIKYVISDGQIANANNGFRWEPYHGVNPHNKHFHVSVVSGPIADETKPWKFDLAPATGPGDAPIDWPKLRKGDKGETVGKVQQLLGIPVDNIFGADTEKAVKQFQHDHGLVVDGVVGPSTWEALLHGAPKLAVIRHPKILATVFSSDESGTKGCYGKWVDGEDTIGVALPYRFEGPRPRVKISYNGKIIPNIEIIDVGPWNVRDSEYVLGEARPRVERDPTDDYDREPKNKAGIDLSPALARELGIEGKAVLDWWEFQK